MSNLQPFTTYFLFYKRYTPIDNMPDGARPCFPFAHGQVCPSPTRRGEPNKALIHFCRNQVTGGVTSTALDQIISDNPELVTLKVIEDTGDTLVMIQGDDYENEYHYNKDTMKWIDPKD